MIVTSANRMSRAMISFIFVAFVAFAAACGGDGSTATSTSSTAVNVPIPSGDADVVQITDVRHLLTWVDDIMLGTVVEVGPGELRTYEDQPGASTVYTPVKIVVAEPIHGSVVAGQEILLTQFGGVAGGFDQQPIGAAIPTIGQPLLVLTADKPWDRYAFFDLMTIEDGVLGYQGLTGESPMAFALNMPLDQFIAEVHEAEQLPPPTTRPQATVPIEMQTTLAISEG